MGKSVLCYGHQAQFFTLALLEPDLIFKQLSINLFLDLDNLPFIFFLILFVYSDKTSGKRQFLTMHFCSTKRRGIPNLNRVLKFYNAERGVHQKQS